MSDTKPDKCPEFRDVEIGKLLYANFTANLVDAKNRQWQTMIWSVGANILLSVNIDKIHSALSATLILTCLFAQSGIAIYFLCKHQDYLTKFRDKLDRLKAAICTDNPRFLILYGEPKEADCATLIRKPEHDSPLFWLQTVVVGSSFLIAMFAALSRCV